MALQYGFFNAIKQSDGTYDRKYNALDYSRNIGAFVSTGVRRSQLDDFKPTLFNSNSNIKFNAGYAWIEGHWAYNDSDYQMDVQAQPVGDNNRRDVIVLRLNTNTADRNIAFKYIKGQEISGTAYPNVTSVIQRSGGIYDIALCSLTYEKSGTSYNLKLEDLRANKEVCGWVTTPVGYDDYFTSLDNAFNEWFVEKKNQLASVTMVKRYHQHIVVENETSQVQFNIPQYDASGVDLIDVYVNGILATYDVDYTVEGSLIKFTTTKIGGTEIDVRVIKSIDGTGLGSVSDEITELQNQMATVKNIGEYIYICNGIDDNVQISNLVKAMFTSSDSNKQAMLSIYGDFGCTAPASGAGSNVSAYRWFDLSLQGSGNRVILDFEGCSQIVFNCKNTYSYIGFYGSNIIIKNAIVVVNHKNAQGDFRVFSATITPVEADHCRFILNGDCRIASTGTFNECYGIVKHLSNEGNQVDTQLFRPIANSLLRINGGEYLVYGNGQGEDQIINAQGACAIICNNVNAPSAAVSGYYQGQFFVNNSSNTAYATFNDCITTLRFDLNDSAKIKVNNKLPFNFTNR